MSKDEPETVTPHLERVLSRLLRRRSRSRLADGLTRQIGRAEPESDSGKKISTRRWSSACNGTSHFYKWFQRGQPSWLDCGTHKVPKYCLFCRNNKIKYSRPFHCTITNMWWNRQFHWIISQFFVSYQEECATTFCQRPCYLHRTDLTSLSQAYKREVLLKGRLSAVDLLIQA